MRFHIICMLMKVIINLKIDHENLFVAFNVILVLWNIFLKYYMFLWNTICFFCKASTKTIVSCLLPFSLFYQGKYFFSVLKFWIFIWWKFFFFSWWRYISPRKTLYRHYTHGELFFDKAIFIDDFWHPVAFEKLLNFSRLFSFRNCKFWRALRLFLNRVSLTSIFSFFKSFKYPPDCFEYSHHYWSKQSYARFLQFFNICAKKSCYSNDLLVSLKRQLSFDSHLL